MMHGQGGHVPIRFRSLAIAAVVAVASLAIAGEFVARPTVLAPVARVEIPRPPPPVVEVRVAEVSPPPVDATMDAIELELASRLVGVAPGEAHAVAKVLVEEARKAGFDPWYIVAVIEAESMYDADACSPAGARGLMQLMPTTFRSVSTHYRVSDPVENVRAGIHYLAKLYAAGFNYPNTALLAYNGGPANALAYLKAIWAKKDTSSFPAEMKEYPGKVLTRYKRLRHAVGDEKPNVAKTWRLP